MAESHTATFSDLLNHLFETHRRPRDGRTYSLREVVATMPGTISIQHLSNLRRGDYSTNPSYEIIEGLCLFFGVEPNYFFPQVMHKLGDRAGQAQPDPCCPPSSPPE